MSHDTPLGRHLEFCEECLQGLDNKLCASGQQLANEAQGIIDAKPWLERDWYMIRQYRLDYPKKRVDSVEGCNCDHFLHKEPHNDHSAGVHFSFEDDRSQSPQKTEIFPIFLEKETDTKYVRWAYSLYGPVGTSGELTPQAIAKLERVTRRKDRSKLTQFISTLDRADRIGQTVAESMLTAKHGKQVDLTKSNGRNKA